MIPRKIHYCWFGHGEKPPIAQKCIASWKKYCPDYEIIEWNEDNFDVNMNGYTLMCYEQKKYAFLTDYIRLMVLLEQGGLYFDTDVELLRNFNDLLDQPAFFGFEDDVHINTGVGCGCEPGNPAVKTMLEAYEPLLAGDQGVIGCPVLNTQALIKHGLVLNGEKQQLDHAVVYPADWFNPYDDPTGRLRKTQNTHSIHWFSKSWMSKTSVLRSMLTRPLHRIFGKNFFRKRRKSK